VLRRDRLLEALAKMAIGLLSLPIATSRLIGWHGCCFMGKTRAAKTLITPIETRLTTESAICAWPLAAKTQLITGNGEVERISCQVADGKLHAGLRKAVVTWVHTTRKKKPLLSRQLFANKLTENLHHGFADRR
jgi:hypothetical protein